MAVHFLKMATLSNVCSMGKLNKGLNLSKIAIIFEKSKINTSKFHSLILKKFHKTATLLVYESGNVVSVGAKTVEDSKDSIEAFVNHLNSHKYPHELIEFKITNMVGSSMLGYKIRLDSLYEANRENTYWEPELFPGLQYRFQHLGVTVNVFASGKLYVTGAKSWCQIEEAVKRLKRIALRHKCKFQ